MTGELATAQLLGRYIIAEAVQLATQAWVKHSDEFILEPA